MAVRVLVGAQWGDEGKGKVVDYLGRDAKIIARFAGGPNAGHTVVIEGRKSILHHVPSGILNPEPLCLLGNGVVVDAAILREELRELREGGVETQGRLCISPRAHVILGTHRLLDRVSEEDRGAKAIGTTGKGIGPAYGDKVLRRGIRVGDLLEHDTLSARVQEEVAEINRVLVSRYRRDPIDAGAIEEEAREAGRFLAPFVADTGKLLRDAVVRGENVLLEGAQGTMLDLDHGTYPFATSSSATAGGACTGTGVGPTAIDEVWGVAKAYCTRVGNGPFPTELLGAEGDELRRVGAEFGATTGRPRRCGWFDAVAVRYAVEVSGIDSLAITKLDILTGLPELKICTAYRIDGEVTTDFPWSVGALERLEPVYESHPGWTESLDAAQGLEDLPANARSYLDRLRELTGARVALVGVGPNRSQTILCEEAAATG